MFLPLAIEVFGCLHQQADGFFINVLTWRGEQRALEALFKKKLHSSYKHWVLVALQ
jgi:hypothetical protein